MESDTTINFKEQPYRGILKRVAEQKNITPQAVGKSYRKNNPDTVAIVNREIKRRNSLIAEKELLAQSV